MSNQTENQIETEEQLVARAQRALSSCNWEIGECAATWTERYGKGRTDADFGNLIGLSGDQVYQRRRVWETFADVHKDYPQLKWSHFYVALNWDDAAECLQWANEMEATIAEMKAWRRAQRGEDLTAPGEEELPPFAIPDEIHAAGHVAVRDPDELAAVGGSGGPGGGGGAETVTAAARESSGENYAPFHQGARGDAPGDDSAARPEPTTEQIVKRLCSSLERCDSALTPAVLEDFVDVPHSLQQRLLNALDNLESKLSTFR